MSLKKVINVILRRGTLPAIIALLAVLIGYKKIKMAGTFVRAITLMRK